MNSSRRVVVCVRKKHLCPWWFDSWINIPPLLSLLLLLPRKRDRVCAVRVIHHHPFVNRRHETGEKPWTWKKEEEEEGRSCVCVLAMGSVRSCPDLVYSKKKKTRIGKRKKKNKRDCDHAVHTQLHTRVLLLFSSVVFASIPPSLRRSLPYHSSIHIHCVCMHGSTSLSLSLYSLSLLLLSPFSGTTTRAKTKNMKLAALSLSQMMMTSKGGKTAVTFRLLLAFALVVKGHTQTQAGHISISFSPPLSSLPFLRLLLFLSDFLLVYVRAHTRDRARESLSPFLLIGEGEQAKKKPDDAKPAVCW